MPTSTITGGWPSSPKSTTDRSPSWSAWRATALPTKGPADIGLVVADAWQGLGLGSLLLEEILRAGEQRGIHRVQRRRAHGQSPRAPLARPAHGDHAADGGQRRHQRRVRSPCGLRPRGHETRKLLACDSRCSDRVGSADITGRSSRKADTTSRSSHAGPTWRRCNNAA